MSMWAGTTYHKPEEMRARQDGQFWYWQVASGAYSGLSEVDGDMYWLDRQWPYDCQNYCDELDGGKFQVLCEVH